MDLIRWNVTSATGTTDKVCKVHGGHVPFFLQTAISPAPMASLRDCKPLGILSVNSVHRTVCPSPNYTTNINITDINLHVFVTAAVTNIMILDARRIFLWSTVQTLTLRTCEVHQPCSVKWALRCSSDSCGAYINRMATNKTGAFQKQLLPWKSSKYYIF